jgi:hypothetical protein
MRSVICGPLSIFPASSARGLQFAPNKCEDFGPKYFPLTKLHASHVRTATKTELMPETQYLIKLDERFATG